MPGYRLWGSSGRLVFSWNKSMPKYPATAAMTRRTAPLATIQPVTSFQTNQSNMAAIMGPLLPGLSMLLATLPGVGGALSA